MNIEHFQALIAVGSRRSAEIRGQNYSLYRPRPPLMALACQNRLPSIRAYIEDISTAISTDSYSRGNFDTSFTSVGDYLVNENEIWFVASQRIGERSLCVLCNASVTLVSSLAPLSDEYGHALGNDAVILDRYPGRLLASSSSHATITPGHVSLASWTAELPVMPIAVAASDVLIDQFDRRFIVLAAQLTCFGWRLSLREAGI